MQLKGVDSNDTIVPPTIQSPQPTGRSKDARIPLEGGKEKRRSLAFV
jgi:hypothetical protein